MKTRPCIEPLETRIAPATATWIAGSGNWSNPANWSGGVVPNNVGGTTFDVTIDVASTPTITVDGTFTISSLTNAERIEITTGALNLSGAINVTGQILATLPGSLNLGLGSSLTVTGSGAIVSAGGATMLTDVALTASGGGVISFPALTTFGGTAGQPIRASGSGSLINLATATTITGGKTFTAESGGDIALGGAISGCAIDLSGAGSDIIATNVSSLTGTIVSVTGRTLSFPGVTTMTNCNLSATAAGGVGGVLDFTALTTFGGTAGQPIRASGSGSLINLATATTITGGKTFTAESGGDIALGGAISGCAIDLSGADSDIIATNVSSLTGTTVSVAGRTISFPGVTTMTNCNLSATAVGGVGGVLDFTALTTFGGTAGQPIRASGSGSLINLATATTITGGKTFTAESGGDIALGGAISGCAIDLSGAGSDIIATNVSSLTGTTVSVAGRTISFPRVTTMTNCNLSATAVGGVGGVLDFTALTTFGGTAGQPIRASGSGSLINLATATAITGGKTFTAESGGDITLGGAISGCAINLSGANSSIGVANVTSLVGTSLAATNGATFIFSAGLALTFGGGITMTASDTGSEFINRATLTASGTTVTINGNPFVNEGVLNPVGNGVFDINGELQIDAGGIITGDTTGRVNIAGNLTGDAFDTGLVFSQATIRFDRGNTATPQFLEAMSANRTGSIFGFSSNYTYKSLAVAANTLVKVVDAFDNAPGSTKEAIYAEKVDVAPGATLDLQGHPLYVLTAVTGTVINGPITELPSPAGTFVLELAESFVNEGDATDDAQLVVKVKRLRGKDGAVSVQLATVNGSARAGFDFTGVSQTVNFADQETADKTVLIPILGNGVIEPDRTFTVALANASVGATIGAQRAATVTLYDDDAPARITLESGSVIVEENAGTVSFVVSRTGARGAVASANYAFVDGTAVNGVDFTGANGAVSFAIGETTKVISFNVLNRPGVQQPPDRTFTLALSPPVNAGLGAHPTTATTIREIAGVDVTKATPLILTEDDGDKVLITVSKGTLDRDQIVVIRQDGEIVIPLLDLSNNTTLAGASVSVREIVAATRTPVARLLAGAANFSATALASVDPGLPIILGKFIASKEMTSLEIQGDVTQIVVPEESKLRKVIVGSFGQFQLKFPGLENAGFELPKDHGVPIALTVTGDVTGSTISLPNNVAEFVVKGAVNESVVTLGNTLGKFEIGSTLGGTFHIGAPVRLLKVGGAAQASDFYLNSPVTTLQIAGDVGSTDFFLFAGAGTLTLQGDVVDSSAEIGAALGRLNILGSLVTFGVKVPEPPEASAAAAATTVVPTGKVGRLGIGGSAANLTTNADIGQLAVAGILAGSTITFPERVTALTLDGLLDSQLTFKLGAGALTVNGDVAGSTLTSEAPLGAVKIGGDVTGSLIDVIASAPAAGKPLVGLASFTVDGHVQSSTIASNTAMGAVKIGGHMIGATLTATDSTPAPGKREVGIASLTVDGDVASNSKIASDTALGAVKIGGHLLDSIISAVGTAAPTTAAAALAISSVAVGGRVEGSTILAGYNLAGAAKNPDVQIGAITVGGEWIASSLSAGIKDADQKFGTPDDTANAAAGAFANPATIPSRIASIAIKGQVLGSLANPNDHFGFVAEQIGPFTVGTTRFPLTTGADEFVVGATGDVKVRELDGVPLAPPNPALPGFEPGANNKVATFTDVDGDLVTVKTDKGEFNMSQFTLVDVAGGLGQQLRMLALHDQPAFAGANISITATRSAGGGDGWVNVGFLKAREGTTGIDLGAVTIEGDLGRISAGDGDAAKPAVASLKVHSIGRYGTSTQAAGGNLQSAFAGALGALTVDTDLLGATLATDTTFGAVKVGFDVVNTTLSATGPLAPPAKSTVLAIKSVVIGGSFQDSSLLGGSVRTATGGNPDAAIGAITIAGDFTRSLIAAGVQRGTDAILGSMDDVLMRGTDFVAKIASLVVAGAATGAPAGAGVFAGEIGSVKIGGAVVPLKKGAGNDKLSTGGTDGILIYEVPAT